LHRRSKTLRTERHFFTCESVISASAKRQRVSIAVTKRQWCQYPSERMVEIDRNYQFCYSSVMENKMSQGKILECRKLLGDALGVLGEIEVALSPSRYDEDRFSAKRNIAAEVYDFAEGREGYFTSRNVDTALRLRGNERNSRRVALSRMVKGGLLERHTTRPACFRWLGVK